jgi:hypothetical protein
METQNTPASEPAKVSRKRSGRRFSKFEKDLFATFEHSQGRENVRLAIAIIRGEKTCDHLCLSWSLRQGTRASRLGCKLEALDRLLGTHGIEQLTARDDCGGYGIEGYTGPTVDYLNAGDTYTATVCFVHGAARPWRIACWGDFAERYYKPSRMEA